MLNTDESLFYRYFDDFWLAVKIGHAVILKFKVHDDVWDTHNVN